ARHTWHHRKAARNRSKSPSLWREDQAGNSSRSAVPQRTLFLRISVVVPHDLGDAARSRHFAVGAAATDALALVLDGDIFSHAVNSGRLLRPVDFDRQDSPFRAEGFGIPGGHGRRPSR